MRGQHQHRPSSAKSSFLRTRRVHALTGPISAFPRPTDHRVRYVPRALGLSSPHTTDSPPSSPPPSPPRLQDAESPPADGSATYVALDEIAPAETVQKPVLAAEVRDNFYIFSLLLSHPKIFRISLFLFTNTPFPGCPYV